MVQEGLDLPGLSEVCPHWTCPGSGEDELGTVLFIMPVVGGSMLSLEL